MGRRLPALTSRRVARALQKAGFVEVRQRGSHLILRHPVSKRKITVPRHSGDLPRGLMLAIIRDAGLTTEEFALLL